MKNINPTTLKSWKKISSHFDLIKDKKIIDFFKENKSRMKEMSYEWEDFYFDFSKNRIDEKVLKIMSSMADEAGLSEAIKNCFSGKKINITEDRSVLHTAVRDFSNEKLNHNGLDIIPEIKLVRKKIKEVSNKLINGNWKGYTGKRITHVVNVGIGGSDLGPKMVCEALNFYKNHFKTLFISNIDGDHVMEILKDCPLETTLFIIVSKTFTTQETLTNAKTIRSWFLKEASKNDISKHFIAVSSNLQKIKEFGIDKENIFPMKNWVGGRFSLWSAVGLIISISLGYENFEKLLKGANSMDKHFKEAPFEKNIPVIMSFISIWYNNFYKSETEAIIPYTEYLKSFPEYLQQASMESNGKSVDRNGESVNYQTGTIIWGSTGTNAQHAFFQLIHQGTKLIPADFIGFKKSLHKKNVHHDNLIANFIAQTEALMIGKNQKELANEKVPNSLIPYKVFEGNKPTTSIFIEKLTPYNLGALIAAYEHKIFSQGILWNIFSFDQWGVELGKKLANKVFETINSKKITADNLSTKNLINIYMNS
ncbi:MAG: glucose-6-phosphate isomerase [Flavobacteriales bacterium]|nr:glucose-6-phosphate isomerase [Flavobacteriales bacterium]